jgi:hypothetical protein
MPICSEQVLLGPSFSSAQDLLEGGDILGQFATMASDMRAQGLDGEEDDDYMNMTFGEEPTKTETSLQRRQRLKREGEIKGMVKSKTQREAEEAEARERALSRSMLDDPTVAKKNKGFAMMAKMGFKGGALGNKHNPDAKAEPIKVSIKEDRGGIGLDSERKRKLQEAAAKEEKRAKVDPLEFRDRVRKEREQARLEKQVNAAMKVAEQMSEENESIEAASTSISESGKRKKISPKPLKAINVLWRGLVRNREERERDKRMRKDLEDSLPRLPTYVDEHEDEDDRRALGKDLSAVYVTAEDLDEEDPELEEFNAKDVEEKLRLLLSYLRKEHRYCFWCKYTYPDEEMVGCPGISEEEHD